MLFLVFFIIFFSFFDVDFLSTTYPEFVPATTYQLTFQKSLFKNGWSSISIANSAKSLSLVASVLSIIFFLRSLNFSLRSYLKLLNEF